MTKNYNLEQEDLIKKIMGFLSNPIAIDSDKFALISAKGGTGKTECVIEAIRRLKALSGGNMRYILMGYTNKAVAVLNKRIFDYGMDEFISASTIHRTLYKLDGAKNHHALVCDEVKIVMDENKVGETDAVMIVAKKYGVYDNTNPYTHKSELADGLFKSGIDLSKLKFQEKEKLIFDNCAFVIDEATMVNDSIIRTLRKCYSQSTNLRILFLGDVRQLPPIGVKATDTFFYKYVGGFDAPKSLGHLTKSYRTNNVDIPALADKSFEYYQKGRGMVGINMYKKFLVNEGVKILNVDEMLNEYKNLFYSDGEYPIVISYRQSVKNVCNAMIKNVLSNAPIRDYESQDYHGNLGKVMRSGYFTKNEYIITNNELMYGDSPYGVVKSETTIPPHLIYSVQSKKNPKWHDDVIYIDMEGNLVEQPQDKNEIFTKEQFANVIERKDSVEEYFYANNKTAREIGIQVPYWEAYPMIKHLSNLKNMHHFYNDMNKLVAKNRMDVTCVLSHARTCYKMQGDEAKHIFIALDGIGWSNTAKDANINNALHFYTAITRAKENVYFFDTSDLHLGDKNFDKKYANLLTLMKKR